MKVYKHGVLPKGKAFSVFNRKHLEESLNLFNLFYYASNFETFKNSVVWARFHFNPGQFVYALTLAVAHREDFKGVVLPPPYEVTPHLFVKSDVLQKAFELKFLTNKNDSDPIVLTVNNTKLYPCYQYDDENESHNCYFDKDYDRSEERLSYFTEDVGLNSFNYFHHVFNPFFLDASYGYKLEGRGELFFYYHQQVLARYILERLSNDLQKFEPLTFGKPVKHGYDPNLRYPNGKAFPVRPDDVTVLEHESFEYQLLDDYANRVLDAVDFGSLFTPDLKQVLLSDSEGLDHLGHVVEGTAKSVHPRYYGKLFYYGMRAFGNIADVHKTHSSPPGVLEHYQTAFRDPMYYRLIAFLTNLYHRFKSHFDEYTHEELEFPGVKVSNVEVDNLLTFFEEFEFDVTTLASKQHEKEPFVRVRQYRLNHKPFNYKVHVTSEKDSTAMFRVFLGPKYDSEGLKLPLNERRKSMVEIDRFPYSGNSNNNKKIFFLFFLNFDLFIYFF